MSAAGSTERILWIIVIVLAGWYLLGTWMNRRRSKAIGSWLEQAIRPLGGKGSWKWVGTVSSGAKVTISSASSPFSQLEITYLLLTREFLPLWAIELLRGKRDMLVIRANLAGDVRAPMEIVPEKGELHTTLDRHSVEQPWSWQAAPAGLVLGTQESSSGITPGKDQDEKVFRGAHRFLEEYGQYIRRLSVRQRRPNVILFAHLTGLEHTPPGDFIQGLRGMLRPGSAARKPLPVSPRA